MSTLEIKIKKEIEAEISREYIAECLRLLTENAAGLVGGKCMKISLHDVLHPKKNQEEKAAEEIIREVSEKSGIEVI